jgi:hypothetical protein
MTFAMEEATDLVESSAVYQHSHHYADKEKRTDAIDF